MNDKSKFDEAVWFGEQEEYFDRLHRARMQGARQGGLIGFFVLFLIFLMVGILVYPCP